MSQNITTHKLELINSQQVSEKPNVLFIITDDQGYGDLGLTYKGHYTP